MAAQTWGPTGTAPQPFFLRPCSETACDFGDFGPLWAGFLPGGKVLRQITFSKS